MVFCGKQFVLHCVGVVAEDGLLVSGIDIVDEGKVEGLFAGLEERFVIRFEVHQIVKLY